MKFDVLPIVGLNEITGDRKQIIAEGLKNADRQLEIAKEKLDELNAEIKKLTNEADALDYAVAVISGVITGMIDSFFVGETEIDKEKIEMEYSNKKGLRYAYIVGIVMLIVYAYMIIPGLPNSGLLLDMNEFAYVNQLFGANSYFQSGFTYLVSIWFLAVGIAYALGAKTLKNDKELIEKISVFFKDIGGLIITVFFFVQFISVFKKTNIGVIISCWGADLINNLSFNGILLIILSLLVMSISGIFLTSLQKTSNPFFF